MVGFLIVPIQMIKFFVRAIILMNVEYVMVMIVNAMNLLLIMII